MSRKKELKTTRLTKLNIRLTLDLMFPEVKWKRLDKFARKLFRYYHVIEKEDK